MESVEAMASEFERLQDEEFLQYERVQNKFSRRSDLHALVLLDKLQPCQYAPGDIMSAAEHDQVWLGIDTEQLALVITAEQICELLRCGVTLDSETGDLYMFV